jgi:hypothetical protein
VEELRVEYDQSSAEVGAEPTSLRPDADADADADDASAIAIADAETAFVALDDHANANGESTAR